MKQYSFRKGLKKSVLAVVLFGLPFFVTNFPEVANLTIGGALMLLVNWAKVRFAA